MSKHAWARLPADKKIDLLVRQAEWVIFMATMKEIDVDQRSVNAIVRVRQGGRGSDLIGAFLRAADVLKDGRLGDLIFPGRTVFDRYAIEYFCYRLAYDVYTSRIANDIASISMTYLYLVLGLERKSPLGVWKRDNYSDNNDLHV